MSIFNSQIRKKVFRFFKSRLGEENTRKMQYLPFTFANKVRKPPYVKVSNCCWISNHGIFINGWMLTGSKSVESVRLEFSKNNVFLIDKYMRRIPRSDIQSKYSLPDGSLPGFIGYAPFSEFSENTIPESFEKRARFRVIFDDGTVRTKSISVSQSSIDPLISIKRILSAIPSTFDNKKQCFDHVYGPAIEGMWSSRDTQSVDSDYIRYNEYLSSDKPIASLIVPIYGRYDFIEYQLCQFVNDNDMLKHEIIYVIDDPRILSEVKKVCEVFEKLYKIPFNVLYLQENCGFAGANNQGVKKATGKYVLMLNSDVMPAQHGWVSSLIDSSENVIENSLVGVRLLYEDESIQHDGMKFYQSPFQNKLWTNTHPGKGMPADIIKTNSHLVDVEAITGACVLLSMDNFIKLGGLDENYILGDYEDSDLCLKARQQGLSVKLNRAIHLYHLERQSQSLVSADRWKNELTYYNCWYHNRKWHKDIVNLKSEYASHKN